VGQITVQVWGVAASCCNPPHAQALPAPTQPAAIYTHHPAALMFADTGATAHQLHPAGFGQARLRKATAADEPQDRVISV
jgi:hypothetical protein